MSDSKWSALPESTTLPNAGILSFVDLTQAAGFRNRRITANNLFKMAGDLEIAPTGSLSLTSGSTLVLTPPSNITLIPGGSISLNPAGTISLAPDDAITVTPGLNKDLDFVTRGTGAITFSTPLDTDLMALADTTSKVGATPISIVNCDSLHVLGEFGINANRDYDDDLLGFGWPVRGTQATTSCAASCSFNTADVYPLTQFIGWAHDNIEFLWDAYTQDHTTYKSASFGSNMRFTKSGATWTLQSDTSVIEGNNITWNNIISIAASTQAVTFATQAILGNLILISTIPGTDPASGKQYLYVNASGQLEARGASGTITILAAA